MEAYSVGYIFTNCDLGEIKQLVSHWNKDSICGTGMSVENALFIHYHQVYQLRKLTQMGDNE